MPGARAAGVCEISAPHKACLGTLDAATGAEENTLPNTAPRAGQPKALNAASCAKQSASSINEHARQSLGLEVLDDYANTNSRCVLRFESGSTSRIQDRKST